MSQRTLKSDCLTKAIKIFSFLSQIDNFATFYQKFFSVIISSETFLCLSILDLSIFLWILLRLFEYLINVFGSPKYF